MAGKNQVTLTFAGDSTKLEQAFKGVGSAAKTMGDDVGTASRKVGDSTDSFDKLGGGLDTTYDKFDSLEAVGRGTTDTMSGLSSIMKGDLLQGSTDLAGGVAALADGIGGALVPMLKNGVTWIKNTTIAQRLLNLTMMLNPIGLVVLAIVALVAVFVIAWKKSETFRNIVKGALGAVRAAFMWLVDGFGKAWKALSGAWSRFTSWVSGWKTSVTNRVKSLFAQIGAAFSAAWTAVSGAWGRFIGWVSGWKTSITNRIYSAFAQLGGAFSSAWTTVSGAWGRLLTWVGGWKKAISGKVSGMWDGIKEAFRSAINWMITKWNNLEFRIPSIDTHIPGVGHVGGFTLGTPNIPTFHTGGIMPGAPGSEGLALLQAGERITPAGRSSGPIQVVLRFEGRGDLVNLMRESLRAKGLGRDVVAALETR
jgi:phage-related protein